MQCDSSALEFILSRSRSRDLQSKVSVFVSRPKKGIDNNTGCMTCEDISRHASLTKTMINDRALGIHRVP